MKKLIIPALVLLLLRSLPSLASCTIPTNSLGVTCVQGAGAGGATTNESYKQSSWNAPTAGDTVAVIAYQCWNSNCNGTGTTLLSITDASGDPDTHFVLSPHGIFTLIESGSGGQTLQQAQWEYTGVPSNLGSYIQVNCCPSGTPNCSSSQAVSTCNYMTLTTMEFGGMPSSGNIWDVDGGGISTVLTQSGSVVTCNWSNSTGACGTSVSINYTNELCISYVDNTNDETMTAGTGSTIMQQWYAGNTNLGLIATTTGVQTLNFTWSGNDNYYGTIGCLKTAQSVAAINPAAIGGKAVMGGKSLIGMLMNFFSGIDADDRFPTFEVPVKTKTLSLYG